MGENKAGENKIVVASDKKSSAGTAGTANSNNGDDEVTEESHVGSVLLTISGILLGICIVGAVIIFCIRRRNNAKYSESGTAMGHVYGYGGNATKPETYKD